MSLKKDCQAPLFIFRNCLSENRENSFLQCLKIIFRENIIDRIRFPDISPFRNLLFFFRFLKSSRRFSIVFVILVLLIYDLLKLGVSKCSLLVEKKSRKKSIAYCQQKAIKPVSSMDVDAWENGINQARSHKHRSIVYSLSV